MERFLWTHPKDLAESRVLVGKLQFAEGRGGSFLSPDKEGGWQTWTYLLEEIKITGKVNTW